MKKDNQIDIPQKTMSTTIRGLSHDGRGIASINQITTFITGVLPGETITYNFLRKRKHYQEATCSDILIPSPLRVTPPCHHFGICGGCSLQHMSTEAQLELKLGTLLDQLKHFGHVSPETLLPPLSGNTIGYRGKARIGVRYVYKKNKLLIGFREKSSRYLADLSRCAVLHPKVGDNFSSLRELITSLSCSQDIPQIEIAKGDKATALVFRHLQTLNHQDLQKLIEFGRVNHYHIYTQSNLPPIQKLWPDDENHLLDYTLPNQGLRLFFHPLDFTQINLEINHALVDQALRELKLQSNENALDLFCGIGNFTLAMAQQCKKVIGIEGSEAMIARSNHNADYNKINNAFFYQANLEKICEAMSWTKLSYDKILLDPPRTGAQHLLPLIGKSHAKIIVYVSCNSATLARDAGELVHTYGYQLKKAGIINMFPHTTHVEAMAVFEQKN